MLESFEDGSCGLRPQARAFYGRDHKFCACRRRDVLRPCAILFPLLEYLREGGTPSRFSLFYDLPDLRIAHGLEIELTDDEMQIEPRLDHMRELHQVSAQPLWRRRVSGRRAPEL